MAAKGVVAATLSLSSVGDFGPRLRERAAHRSEERLRHRARANERASAEPLNWGFCSFLLSLSSGVGRAHTFLQWRHDGVLWVLYAS